MSLARACSQGVFAGYCRSCVRYRLQAESLKHPRRATGAACCPRSSSCYNCVWHGRVAWISRKHGFVLGMVVSMPEGRGWHGKRAGRNGITILWLGGDSVGRDIGRSRSNDVQRRNATYMRAGCLRSSASRGHSLEKRSFKSRCDTLSPRPCMYAHMHTRKQKIFSPPVRT